MKYLDVPRRYPGCLLAVLCLTGILPAVSPVSAAPPPSRPFERTFRYPYPVPALIETLAQAQERERTMGRPAQEPGEDEEPRNPSEGPERVRLMPGAKQAKVVVPVSGALPSPAFGLLPPFDPMPPSPSADTKFDGPSFTGNGVPDDGFAAGPTHVVSVVNSYIQVRTIAGAAVATVSFANFFPTEPTRFGFDPHAVYDPSTGRFVVVALGVKRSAPQISTCMFAVSATSDPTGVWYKYVVDVGRGGTPPTEWADYPGLGYDGTAIFFTFGMFSFGQDQFRGNRVLIIDKSQALAGQTLSGVRIIDNISLPPPFPPNSPTGTLRPVEAAEPVSPALMLSTAGLAGLALYKITDPLGASGGPSIQVSFIDTTDFEVAGTAPQAGSGIALSTSDSRLEKTVLRGGIIWACNTVSSTGARGGKAQVNVYKVLPSGDGVLMDVKSIVDNSRAYYYPAIVPDLFGNAIVLFQGSDATSFASMYIARWVGATGQIEPPTLVEAGISPYVLVDNLNRARWGDYQNASLDVVTGTHVWVQGMLALAADLWHMHIARIPSSPPVAPGSLTASAVASSQVNLAWTDNSIGETGFKIERKTADAEFVPVATLGPDATRYSDTGLSPTTAYTYRVRSFNGAGDSQPPAEVGVTTPERSVGVASVFLAPNPVQGGSAVIGIVTLDGPAAPSALTVALASSNAAVAGAAVDSLVFPLGLSGLSFMVNTTAVSAPTSVTITASLNGTSKSATLDVRP